MNAILVGLLIWAWASVALALLLGQVIRLREKNKR